MVRWNKNWVWRIAQLKSTELTCFVINDRLQNNTIRTHFHCDNRLVLFDGTSEVSKETCYVIIYTKKKYQEARVSPRVQLWETQTLIMFSP